MGPSHVIRATPKDGGDTLEIGQLWKGRRFRGSYNIKLGARAYGDRPEVSPEDAMRIMSGGEHWINVHTRDWHATELEMGDAWEGME